MTALPYFCNERWTATDNYIISSRNQRAAFNAKDQQPIHTVIIILSQRRYIPRIVSRMMVFDNMRERSSQLSNAFLSFVRTSITFYSMSSREMVTLFSDEKSRFKANTMTVDVSRATMWIKFLMHNQKIRMPQGLSQWENVCWELWLYFKSKMIWIGFLGCSLIIINNITQLLQWTVDM